MERVVVTQIRDDLCLVSHQEQTLSAHTTENEALSVAFAVAARCTQKGNKTVVILTREQGSRRAVALNSLNGGWEHHSHR